MMQACIYYMDFMQVVYTHTGNTPLHIAIMKGYTGMVTISSVCVCVCACVCVRACVRACVCI